VVILKKFTFVDTLVVENYIKANKDRPIIEVYNEIKAKNKKDRSNAEVLVYYYLCLNKKKLGLK